MKKTNQHFHWILLLVTLILSPVVIMLSLFLGKLILPKPEGPLGIPFLVALTFLFMGCLTGIIVMVTSLICKSYMGNLVTGKKDLFKALIIFILCLCLLFGVSMGLEYLYEKVLWAAPGESGQGTYVFLVDDSASMEDSDPTNLRYGEINQILSNVGKGQYMVYSFSEYTEIVQPMTPISGSLPHLNPVDGSITEMKLALEHVMADYRSGVWAPAGPVKVILLTDGSATDVDIGDYHALTILDAYRREQITVNPVGLGEYVDADMLQYIADATGGIYVPIGDSSQLSGAMEHAIGADNRTDNLLSPRPAGYNSILLGFLRVLFLTIIGMLICLCYTFCCGYSKTIRFTLTSGLILSLVSALLIEVLYLLLGYFPLWHLLLIPMVTVLSLRWTPPVGEADSTPDFYMDPNSKSSSKNSQKFSAPGQGLDADDDFFSAPQKTAKGRKGRKSSRSSADFFDDDFDF